MSVIRAFIAISLSSEIHQQLHQVISGLKSRLPESPIRWVPANNIHLTLKFLGDVSVSNQEILTKMMRAEVSRHASFEISVGELGVFPSLRRPHVIWVGVEAPQELYLLHHGIETEMYRLGYAAEDRSFSPHLTLGRVSRNARSNDYYPISEVLSGYKVGFLGALRVQSIDLYRSDLHPDGAVYTCLFSAPLGESKE
jgi:RNA 2',3'-cyclic 3'-phosphodiesterase